MIEMAVLLFVHAFTRPSSLKAPIPQHGMVR